MHSRESFRSDLLVSSVACLALCQGGGEERSVAPSCWTVHALTENSGTLSRTAGRHYSYDEYSTFATLP